VSGQQELEVVQRGLEARRAAAPVQAHETVDAAVQASTDSLAHVAPGKAVVVRAVWRGAQKATVMVNGATKQQVASAQAAGQAAGLERVRQL